MSILCISMQISIYVQFNLIVIPFEFHIYEIILTQKANYVTWFSLKYL